MNQRTHCLVSKPGDSPFFLAELIVDGRMTEWTPLNAKHLEHAEAEALRVYPQCEFVNREDLTGDSQAEMVGEAP